jgi:hypothetical protein
MGTSRAREDAFILTNSADQLRVALEALIR